MFNLQKTSERAPFMAQDRHDREALARIDGSKGRDTSEAPPQTGEH